MAQLADNPDDPEGDGSYWPYLIFPKVVEFDINEETFHFKNLATEINENAADPDYIWFEDEIYLPWDTDNDGEVDEYGDEGEVLMFSGWPIFFWAEDVAFHNNNFKIVKNEEHDWLCAVWQDGLNVVDINVVI